MAHEESIFLFGSIILGLQIVLAIVQFMYRVWDKRHTREIITALQGSITDSVQTFDPHVERSKQAHQWLYQMKEQNGVKDSAGLPLIYRSTCMEETQLELVKLTHTIADTQRYIASTVKKVAVGIDAHKDECKAQFNQLDKKIHA